MAWIEVHQSLPTHRKTLLASETLRIKPVHVVGHITTLWLWCVDNTHRGDLSGMPPRMIARAAHWIGKPERFVDGLVEAGFLDRPTPDELYIHDWEAYTGRLMAQREANAARVRRWRNSPVTDESKAPNDYVTVTERVRNGATNQPYQPTVPTNRTDPPPNPPSPQPRPPRQARPRIKSSELTAVLALWQELGLGPVSQNAETGLKKLIATHGQEWVKTGLRRASQENIQHPVSWLATTIPGWKRREGSDEKNRGHSESGASAEDRRNAAADAWDPTP